MLPSRAVARAQTFECIIIVSYASVRPCAEGGKDPRFAAWMYFSSTTSRLFETPCERS